MVTFANRHCPLSGENGDGENRIMSEENGPPVAKGTPVILFWASVALRLGLVMGALVAVLSLVSGRWDWTMAWVYVGFVIVGGLTNAVFTFRRNPSLIRERARPPADAKAWDRWLVRGVAMYGPLAVYVTAALDHRFGWSARLPAALPWLGLGLLLAGYALSSWALAVNPFFSAVVRIQRDRGHRVIEAGPYRRVRHPGYLGGLLAQLAAPLVLESVWAWIPSALTAALLVVRTALEDRTLRTELEGYSAYAGRVPRRLLPGIW